MKVALCFVGLPRYIKENGSIRQNLIGPIHRANENVDIFVHTWAEKGKELETRKLIYNSYGPRVKEIKIEEPLDFSSLFDFGKFPQDNGHLNDHKDTFCSYLYSVRESINLSLNSKNEYDFIIKARFDSLVVGSLNFSKYEPDFFYSSNNGYVYISDHLNFGSPNVMSIYSKIYDSIPEIFHNNEGNITDPTSAFELVKKEMFISTGFSSAPSSNNWLAHNNWCFEGIQTYYLLKNGVLLTNMNDSLYENPYVNLFREKDLSSKPIK